MGGISGGMGDELSVTSFTSQGFEPDGTRLDVVAIWRGKREARQRHALSIDRWRPPEGWRGSADGDGGREVLFHEQQRRVRVLGSEFTVPVGHTLVLLIDEQQGESMPRIASRSVPAPVFRHPLPDLALPKAERLDRLHARHLAEQEAWRIALDQDEVVRCFLADGTWPEA